MRVIAKKHPNGIDWTIQQKNCPDLILSYRNWDNQFVMLNNGNDDTFWEQDIHNVVRQYNRARQIIWWYRIRNPK